MERIQYKFYRTPKILGDIILSSKSLTPSEKLILTFLLRKSTASYYNIPMNNNNTWIAYSTVRQIARGTNINNSYVSKTLNQLQEKRWLKWTKSHTRKQPSTFLILKST